MKKMKKSKLSIALVISLAVIMTCSIAPTLSWLSATTETVTNSFDGGKITAKLDEGKVENGKTFSDEGKTRVIENSYKYVAGSVLDKDPTPTIIAGSEKCYVYVEVDNRLNTHKGKDAEGNEIDLFTLDIDTDDWKVVSASGDGTRTIYRYKDVVDASGENDVRLPAVFKHVTVSDYLTQDDVEKLGTKKITVNAYAIQSENIELESDNAGDVTANSSAAAYFDGLHSGS